MISAIVSILVVVLVAALAAGAGFIARRESRDAGQARSDRDAAAARLEQVQQRLHDAIAENSRLSEQVRHEQQHAERARPERDAATAQVMQLQRQLQDAVVEKGSLHTQLSGSGSASPSNRPCCAIWKRRCRRLPNGLPVKL